MSSTVHKTSCENCPTGSTEFYEVLSKVHYLGLWCKDGPGVNLCLMELWDKNVGEHG